MSPTSGQGGTRLTIAGIALDGDGTSVVSATLDGIAAASILSQSATQVVVEAGARANGETQIGTITLTMDDGSSIVSVALADGSEIHQFTYQVAGARSEEHTSELQSPI